MSVKFRNPKTGKILNDYVAFRGDFCCEYICEDCPVGKKAKNGLCEKWIHEHSYEAAKAMGYEVVEDSKEVEIDPVKKAHSMTRKEILAAAEACVCGQREEDYGPPEDNLRTIAELWQAYIKARCVGVGVFVDMLPEDMACMMALLKIARIAGGRGTDDSWVDLAGYAACGGELAGGKA